jgi:hypothetical protein
MKFYYLLILFVTSAFMAFSQKCKYDFQKKDPFTGKIQKGNSTVLAGFGPMALRLILQSEEKKYLMGIYIALPGKNENYIEKGDTLSIALDNGEKLSFLAIDRYLPSYQAQYTITTYYEPKYVINEDELRKLSTTGIKATKLKLGSLPLQAEVPPKNAEKVKKAANCILQ